MAKLNDVGEVTGDEVGEGSGAGFGSSLTLPFALFYMITVTGRQGLNTTEDQSVHIKGLLAIVSLFERPLRRNLGAGQAP